jgi:hypothetical protein
MSFFKKALGLQPTAHPIPVAAPVEPVAAPPPPLTGSFPCGADGCGSMTGVRCAYTDRRGTRCPTAWCPDHHRLVKSEPYCRRHFAVAEALAEQSEEWDQRPDTDNRAPSLTQWVSNLVDAEVRALLLQARAERADLDLVADPLNLVALGTPRVRSWQRRWELISNTGPALRVALLVDESNDSEVHLRVDAEIVERVVPPWIQQRMAGERVDAATDAQRRADFTRGLIERIGEEVARKLPLR